MKAVKIEIQITTYKKTDKRVIFQDQLDKQLILIHTNLWGVYTIFPTGLLYIEFAPKTFTYPLTKLRTEFTFQS